ncbi:MAG: RdgB/HAM1 family non-canonical purine NTP pyrophosphatase [Lachnospiraceae bacterium]|nr:RdgB/HAM1 family non-canonical purine NTP pyrophosphatase [Lachnospiraceae bacterium]
MKLLMATSNAGKLKEVSAIMENMDIEVISLKDVGITADFEENGTTFAENAMIKAEGIADLLGEDAKDTIVLADDSGLEIDYLNKEPGVYSARFMGEDTPYTVKNTELIKRLEGVEDEKRTARFVCAMAAIMPDGERLRTQGVMEGRIGYEIAGENGFGYDPIFYLPQYRMTSAQISPQEKNRISHRGKALEQMKELIAQRMAK